MILSVSRNFLIRLVAIMVVCLFVIQPNSAMAGQMIGQENEIIRRVNLIRSSEGLPILNKDNRLMSSALNKAKDMDLNNYFSHSALNDLRMFYWITGFDYSYDFAGENLAKGFTSVNKLMDAWTSSSAHYKNMVNPKFKDIGVGIVKGMLNGKEIVFVVQHFGLEKVSLSYLQQSASSIFDYVTNGPVVLGAVDNDTKTDDTKPSSTQEMDIKILLLIISLGVIGYTVEKVNLFNHPSK